MKDRYTQFIQAAGGIALLASAVITTSLTYELLWGLNL
jgi:hypothetical protein